LLLAATILHTKRFAEHTLPRPHKHYTAALLYIHSDAFNTTANTLRCHTLQHFCALRFTFAERF
jgi:hypothetical protein